METVTPSPQTWTLRLKAHKTTVFLHVDPLHTFDTIKSHLYSALRQTYLTNAQTGEPVPLPESPSDMQLGRPVNAADLQAGFVLGEWEYSAEAGDDEGETKTKGKGKAAAPRTKKEDDSKAAPDNINHCPRGAGLKDGAVLAFRFPGDGTVWAGDMQEEDMDDSHRPSMWGVKVATYEDSYDVGDQAGGDLPMEDLPTGDLPIRA